MSDEIPTPTTSDASPRPVETLAASVAYRLVNAQVNSWPFAHMEIDGFLPTALFRAVRAVDLSAHVTSRKAFFADAPRRVNPARFFLKLTDTDGRQVSDLPPALAELVELLSHQFVASALLHRFRSVIAKRFDGRIPKTLSAIEYLDDRSGYELLPHTDVPRKLVTVLIYLADDGAEPELGTALYVPRNANARLEGEPTGRNYSPDGMIEVHRVPYTPNRALVFAPTFNSFHGVPRLSSLAHPRRLLQFQLNALMVAPGEPTA